MAKVPDTITLGELCRKAAQALAKHGLDRRIDLYREVEIDDPAVRLMLGRSHRVRVRIKITATSLLFEGGETETQALESSLFGVTTATQKLDES
jgi:diphthamide synthase (EF-2-diphthine--ammonia ligase)